MKISFISILVIVLLSGCGSKAPEIPTQDIKAIGTQIAATMIAGAVQTQKVAPTSTNTPKQDLGFTIKVTGMDNPAKPGMFYTAKNGQKLIALEVIIENVSLASLSVNPMYFQLVDKEGFVYGNELFGLDKQITSTDIVKGEKLRGLVAFTTPESSKPAKIKFTVGWLSDTVLTIDIP